MVIALDVDGTLYDGASVADEAVTALSLAREQGHTLVIVTGRRWEDLGRVVPSVLSLCVRAVCEHGGVLVNLDTRHLSLLAEPLESDLIDALVAADVAELDVGQVVVGASAASLAAVSAVNDRVGGGRVIIANKGSIALAPVGCDKGTGLRAALADLHLEHLPVLAIGDAENDLPMFAVATIAVGVANADDAVRASGVQLTTATVGRGVAEALHRFVLDA
jgi:hydroxymethylpyrimidine pyrophosphatase-like HAD family hydrolase